jgi:hypothetical protein
VGFEVTTKAKIKLIWDDGFELPFKLPIFRCIGDDGHDTCVYIDIHKGEPVYVGIAEESGGRLDIPGRNLDHQSFIKNLTQDDFIERRVVATLSREDAEDLESSLIRFYGRKDTGGSLLNWSEGIEKSPIERLEENGANPWELFELHFWGHLRILARKDFAFSKKELEKNYLNEPTRDLFFRWWVQETTKKWGTPFLDPLKELRINERGFGRLAYGSKKQTTLTSQKIVLETGKAFLRNHELIRDDGSLVDGWGDESIRERMLACIFEEQDKRSEEIFSELRAHFLLSPVT